jgi:hypothetical protein
MDGRGSRHAAQDCSERRLPPRCKYVAEGVKYLFWCKESLKLTFKDNGHQLSDLVLALRDSLSRITYISTKSLEVE